MFTITGKIKGARSVDLPKSQKALLALEVLVGGGLSVSTQMWGDDPQQEGLLAQVDVMRNQYVQMEVAAFVARPRTFKDGSTAIQVNYTITNVQFLDVSKGRPTLGMVIDGDVKSARSVDLKNGKHLFVMDVTLDEMLVPVQMWGDDPQQQDLIATVDTLRRRQVRMDVVSCAGREREFKGGSKGYQVNHTVTNVVFVAAPKVPAFESSTVAS